MKKLNIFTALLFALATLNFTTAQNIMHSVKFDVRNLSGPRLGFTVIPGNSAIAEKLKEKKIGSMVSQFGWQFEHQVIPEGGGPQFVVEFVPLVAAVEYGTLIPSANLVLGIRFVEGYEFGIGPNLLIGGDKFANSALVVAAGKTFNYGGVSLLLNFVFATNPSGNRYSLIVGYAIQNF